MFAGISSAVAKKTGKPDVVEALVQAQLKEREKFNDHLRRDATEVVGKLVLGLHTELRGVVEEMVNQANEFWTDQIHKQKEVRQEEIAALKTEARDAQLQLDETVKRYNQVVQQLNAQMAEVIEQRDALRKVAEAKSVAATAQEAVLEDTRGSAAQTVTELSRQLATVQAAAADAALKSQQKRLVLVQTVEKQHKEIEELKQQLKQAKERDEKLTAVSEHLLGKVSNLVSQNKQLQEQLAAAKSGRSTAPSSPAASDEHDEQHTSLPANPLLPLAPDETTVQLAKEKSAEVSPA